MKKIKYCSKCKKNLDIFKFGKNKSRIDGFDVICRECRNKYRNTEIQKEKRDLCNKKYYAENKEKALEYAKKYRARNHKEVLKTLKMYRIKNKKSRAKYAKKYRIKNREKFCLYENRRRARLFGCEERFTFQEWVNLCNKYGNICLACGQKKSLTKDHILPLTKGGKNNIDNIQPLCQECNSSKGIKNIDYREMFLIKGV